MMSVEDKLYFRMDLGVEIFLEGRWQEAPFYQLDWTQRSSLRLELDPDEHPAFRLRGTYWEETFEWI